MIILEEEFKAIVKQYKLTNDELYRYNDHLLLITARGIRKIITAEKLNVAKRVYFDPTGGVVVIARIEKGGAFTKDYQFYESTGEAKSGLNTSFKFPISVAEARANSRAVLMSVGLYEKGIIGEAELDMETEALELMDKRRAQTADATASLLTKISKKKA